MDTYQKCCQSVLNTTQGLVSMSKPSRIVQHLFSFHWYQKLCNWFEKILVSFSLALAVWVYVSHGCTSIATGIHRKSGRKATEDDVPLAFSLSPFSFIRDLHSASGWRSIWLTFLDSILHGPRNCRHVPLAAIDHDKIDIITHAWGIEMAQRSFSCGLTMWSQRRLKCSYARGTG